MSLSKPDYPKFASTTPGTGSPDNIAPTVTQQGTGFDGTAGEFDRGLANWLFVQNYLCIYWSDYTRFNWQEFDGDEADGGGWIRPATIVAPTIGAGLTGTTGAFTGHAFGRRIYLLNVAHTFTASKDTYIDVDQDGTPTYKEVAVSGAAPSLDSSKMRFGFLRTNGTNRTGWFPNDKSTAYMATSLWSRGTVTADGGLGTGGDLAVTGDALIGGQAGVGGDLGVGGNQTVAGTMTAASVLITPGTIYRTIPAAAFNGKTDYGVSDLPLWALFSASSNPVIAGQSFIRTGVNSGAAAPCVAPLPDLPQGSVISACKILADVTNGTVKAALVRMPIDSVSDGDDLSSTGGTTGETLPSGAHFTDLTLDASSGVRTVDNLNYTYQLWIYAAASATVNIYRARIAVTPPSTLGR